MFQVGRVCFEAMLTPSFDIEQSEQFVILTIRVPYIKVGTSEATSDMHIMYGAPVPRGPTRWEHVSFFCDAFDLNCTDL